MAAIPEDVLTSRSQPFDANVFIDAVDAIDVLKGCRILYFDGQRFSELRAGRTAPGANSRTVVIKPAPETEPLVDGKAAASRDSRFYSELLGGALSCGAAVVSWVAVVGSAAAAPVSGGGSTFITYLSWGAAIASSAQCANSTVRVYNETTRPELNDWLDSQEWYATTSTVIDVVSITGAAAATGATIKLVLATRRATGKTLTEVLGGLNRQQRKLLTEELIRAQNPGISNKTLKIFVRAGKYPKRFTQLQLSHATRRQLQDALAAALSFSGSAATGTIRNLAVGVIEEVDAD